MGCSLDDEGKESNQRGQDEHDQNGVKRERREHIAEGYSAHCGNTSAFASDDDSCPRGASRPVWEGIAVASPRKECYHTAASRRKVTIPGDALRAPAADSAVCTGASPDPRHTRSVSPTARYSFFNALDQGAGTVSG